MSSSKMTARMRTTLTKSVGRFLAWCSIMKACRGQPQLRRDGPIVLVLVLPPEADTESYGKAAKLALEGRRYYERRFGDTDTLLLTSWADEWRKRFTGADAAAVFRFERAIVLVRHRMEIPTELSHGADAVIELDRPDVRHVEAAIRLCLGQTATAQEAAEIAAMPLALTSLMLRRGRPLRRSLEAMRILAVPQPEESKPRETAIRLEHLHGLGEAGEWGLDLAQDLADWRAGRIPWSHVDRGVLVSGPPGTGKTTFAKALAGSCGAHLVLGSIGRWQARGHLGDMLKAMRGAFDEARSSVPAIVFLDELDALGDRETLDDRHRQYCTEVIAALLECVDGADKVEGVVVVGATNHPSRIDAAMLRPGRLDRHVVIPLPDAKAREGILRWHLCGDLDGANLSAVAARTEGRSGADLEQIVRDGRRRARRARRDLSIDDLQAALPPLARLPEAMLRRAAIHEAGHVVVALALGLNVQSVEIRHETEMRPGYSAAGGVRIRENSLWERTADQLLDRLCVRLGGLAAEEIILGDRSASGGGAPGSDLHQATMIAVQLEASYGLGQGLALLAFDQELDLLTTLHTSFGLRDRVEKVLAEQMERARVVIRERRRDAMVLAEALLATRLLSSEDIDNLLKPSRREVVALIGDRSEPKSIVAEGQKRRSREQTDKKNSTTRASNAPERGCE
ncbi:AAA family ATPase [Chelativorans sp. ZYF759]|uniref:AAA family ATPase n=1 Tax=Chelativorans sp. ZYF759 TaxID=2692213 RepID=UPI00145F42F9|nr:AAA family ATPase [Chelativorans sp. ZYF759]NMG38930.1 AAA family ATPase [Chelativorans sp. ZYF759]